MDEVDARLEAGMHPYWRPLREAADQAIDYAQHPERRVYMGLEKLDFAMRGTAPRQLTIIQGYSHNGKTLIATHMALSNPDKLGVWATPDESRLSVLSKLTAATSGVSWEQLEQMLRGHREDEAEARRLLYETAERYDNLAVIEQALSPYTLSAAVKDVEEAKGRRVDFVVYDFAKLFMVEGDERAKLAAIKWWNVETGYPVFVLHQVGRNAGRDGEPITIDSGMMGGEDVATFIIGVRRQRKWYESLITDFERKLEREFDHSKRAEIITARDEALAKRDEHLNTITINLVKNKVPPSRLVEEFDLDIDWKTGTLKPRYTVKPEAKMTLRQQVFGGMP